MYFAICSLGIFASIFGEFIMEKRPDSSRILLTANKRQNNHDTTKPVSTYDKFEKHPLTACHSFKEISQHRELKRSSKVFPYSTYNQARRKQTKPKSVSSFLKKNDSETLSEPFIPSELYNKHVTKISQLDDLTRFFNQDKDGDTILHIAIVHNDQVKSKILVQKMRGQTLDVFNKLHQTPLHLSVLTCQSAIVQFLVMNGADVNARDRNGQTALHLASKNADIECVKAIKEGIELRQKDQGIHHEQAECNLKNYQGQAAMHLAVLSGSQEIVITLLDMDANIDVQDGTSGMAPLHHAVEVHNINMVQLLLQNNANINGSTFAGNTALHIATGYHMDQIVRLLIKNGADINFKNFEGDTPFDFMNTRRKSKKECN